MPRFLINPRRGCCPGLSQPLSVFPQQLHRLVGSVDLRLLRVDATRPRSFVLLGNELRHLQGLPGTVGHPWTVDETGPQAVGEPCPGAPARAAGPAVPASPGSPASRPPGCPHTAERQPQPTADELPGFVCLVSGCDLLSLTSLENTRSLLLLCLACQLPDDLLILFAKKDVKWLVVTTRAWTEKSK